MPNRAKHVEVGRWSGGMAGFSLALYGDQGLGAAAVEALGGVLGGHWGGLMPDIFEPATNPRHREFWHSIVGSGGSLTAFLAIVRDWVNALRRRADKINASRDEGDIGSVLHEGMCRALAGALHGFIAGYVSHLILDAGTPAGLPLI